MKHLYKVVIYRGYDDPFRKVQYFLTSGIDTNLVTPQVKLEAGEYIFYIERLGVIEENK